MTKNVKGKRTRHCCLFASLVIVISLSFTPESSYATLYEIINLNEVAGLFGGSAEGMAMDINDSGQIVGYLRTYTAFLFLYSDGILDITFVYRFVGGGDSKATGINNAGQVVGTMLVSPYPPSNFLYEFENDVFYNLGPLSPSLGGYGSRPDIDESGQIVSGHIGTYAGPSNLVDLLVDNPGWIELYPRAMNSYGWIVGGGWYEGRPMGWPYAFLAIPVPPKPVTIYIKPGSDTNPINLKSKGVVPVAIITTNDFDASTVDTATVTFADASPVKRKMEDVNGDGYMDLLLYFRTQDLNLNQDSTEATLTGETMDRADIEGTDSVNIVPKKKK